LQISIEEVGRLLAHTPEGTERRRTDAADVNEQKFGQEGRGLAPLDITPSPREILRVVREVDRAPDMREQRVRELRSRIESGAYQVSGEDIADLIARRALADSLC